MAADCIADDIKANNHKHHKHRHHEHNKHVHTSHVSLPLLVAQFDRHPMFTVSQPKLFPHIPLISPTPPPPPRPHALARAGILQHIYFALLDFPHNISDLVWGTLSAQSNYYTSNPTGPHITHPTIIFLRLLTMVPSTSFGTSQVLPDPIFFLNESYQKIYILRINQTLR